MQRVKKIQMRTRISHQISAAVSCFLLIFLTIARPVRAQQNETDGVIRFFQWKVSQDPDDFFNYDKLGVAYIQKARETGDITYYNLARQALEKSLALESTHDSAAPATQHLAAVYFAEHRFADALALAQKALDLNPSDHTPYALIGDARSEMGEYEKAWAAYSQLADPQAPQSETSGLQYLQETRESNRAFLTGDTKAAIVHMQHAVEISIEGRMPKENIAWSQFTLGEDYFLAGDLARAKNAYEDSLKTYPNYHRGFSGLGKVAAAEGKFSEAIDTYKKAIAVIPLPAYVAALGDVYAKSGNAVEAKKQYDLVEYIGRLNAFNQTVYNRELAVFYADHDIHLREALGLARKEFEIRHDIYTWDALAWTLHKNGQPQEAATAIKEALKLSTHDALLYFHAGIINEGIGKHETAQDYLQRAVALNPQFNILYVDAVQATLQKLSKDSVAAKNKGAVDAQP
jgi:tetratricopeptide (TPR) repeat protein